MHWNTFNFLITLLLLASFLIVLISPKDTGYNKFVKFEFVTILIVLRTFFMIQDFFNLLARILLKFRHLFELQACLVYILAIVGCQLFNGVITQDYVEEQCEDNSDEELQSFWCSMEDTLYTGYSP